MKIEHTNQSMRTIQPDGDVLRLEVPTDAVRTNQPQTKSTRYRTRDGIPTIKDMLRAEEILARVNSPDGVMEFSVPEDRELINWAWSIVNWQKG